MAGISVKSFWPIYKSVKLLKFTALSEFVPQIYGKFFNNTLGSVSKLHLLKSKLFKLTSPFEPKVLSFKLNLLLLLKSSSSNEASASNVPSGICIKFVEK